MGASIMRDIIIPDEGPAYHLHHKEESIVMNQQSSGNFTEFYVTKPEPVVVVKEPSDFISSSIQSCSQVVSNVDEEVEVELTFPEKEKVESVSPESENEVRNM